MRCIQAITNGHPLVLAYIPTSGIFSIAESTNRSNGFWLRVTDYWFLVTGCWFLATGHWPLVPGHWSLALSFALCHLNLKSNQSEIRN